MNQIDQRDLCEEAQMRNVERNVYSGGPDLTGKTASSEILPFERQVDRTTACVLLFSSSRKSDKSDATGNFPELKVLSETKQRQYHRHKLQNFQNKCD